MQEKEGRKEGREAGRERGRKRGWEGKKDGCSKIENRKKKERETERSVERRAGEKEKRMKGSRMFLSILLKLLHTVRDTFCQWKLLAWIVNMFHCQLQY
jgi:hypothetical protein